YDILLIADEVICGFGRTGNWFGSQTMGMTPDIMTIAKGLTSGYAPMGGSILSDRVAKVINETGEFAHGYTYSAHPVAAAVALENLRILDEDGIVDRVAKVTAPYLKARWESLTDHPMVGEAKIVGMMGSIALTPDKDSRARFAADAGTVGLICRERCFANNLVMRHVGDRMIISPPLVISESEIDLLIERARTSIDQACQLVREQGLWQAA
ncbi:MAG: aminotransferase class III-fold pyridoxal phosphate-dependent enzyme, partial [Paracoccus sp. (in: a-proteobacteria)]